MQLVKQHTKDSTIGNILNKNRPKSPKAQAEEESPTTQFRMQTCRLMVEEQLFKLANEILGTIVKEDDSLIEAWYLLAFCLFRLEKFK